MLFADRETLPSTRRGSTRGTARSTRRTSAAPTAAPRPLTRLPPDYASQQPRGGPYRRATSIGIPSLAYRPQVTEDVHLPYYQEEAGVLPSVQNLTNNIAGFVTRGMIQLALSGATQPGSSRSDNLHRDAKTYLRTASLDLDTVCLTAIHMEGIAVLRVVPVQGW